MRPLALDLFAGGGGVSLGLLQAGFDVVGVDLNPKAARYYLRGMARHAPPGARFFFLCADALQVPLEGFSFIWASPPCQAHSCLRPLTGKDYPDLIPATRERLAASGIPYCIENVPGAPLGGFLTLLCGSMFGLATPDGAAELRRHRLFETSWPIALRPQCQHGHVGEEALSVTGTGLGVGGKTRWQERSPVTGHTPVDSRGRRAVVTVSGDRPNSANTPRRALSVVGQKGLPGTSKARRVVSVTGNTPQTNTDRNITRQTYSTADAQHAMGIDWLPMRFLSQAIPPPYARWIGLQALDFLTSGH